MTPSGFLVHSYLSSSMGVLWNLLKVYLLKFNYFFRLPFFTSVFGETDGFGEVRRFGGTRGFGVTRGFGETFFSPPESNKTLESTTHISKFLSKFISILFVMSRYLCKCYQKLPSRYGRKRTENCCKSNPKLNTHISEFFPFYIFTFYTDHRLARTIIIELKEFQRKD